MIEIDTEGGEEPGRGKIISRRHDLHMPVLRSCQSVNISREGLRIITMTEQELVVASKTFCRIRFAHMSLEKGGQWDTH